MRALNVLLSIVISTVMALVVFEFGLRLIPAFRQQPTVNQFDPATGWSKIPGAHVTRTVAGQPIEFSINSNGLRESEVVAPRNLTGGQRILALGDSFVLGFTVDKEHSFVEQLESRLRSDGLPVEVINAGTEAWSIDQEVVWFIERGREYAPDLVLVFPYENDLFWCGQERYIRFDKPRFGANGQLERRELKDPGPQPALQRSAIAKFVGQMVSLVKHIPAPGEFVEPNSKLRLPGEFAALLKNPPDVELDAEARMENALFALKKSCDGLQVPLVVVPIPSKSAIHADEREWFRTSEHGLNGLPDELWSPDRPVEVVLAAAQRQGIETIDPRDALRAAGKERKLYFEKGVEWHLNADGNIALANFLHDELLRRRELLPAAMSVKDVAPPIAYIGTPPRPGVDWRFVAALFGGLWAVLTLIFIATYPDESKGLAPLKVGGMLALVFTIFLGGRELIALVPHAYAPWIFGAFLVGVLGFVAYKLGRRISTILELLAAFVARGHWYLMPLLVVLLSIGSLLVVAASSPLIAPFIYTLF